MKKRIMAVCIAGIVAVCSIGLAFASEPGSSDDPLISKSYIDEVLLPELYAYIENAIAGITPSGGVSDKFEVVNVGAGKQVIGGAGTEMILRMGSGSIIASARGGLSDVTEGVDLGDGVSIPSNHLMIIPLDDGRGVQIAPNADAILMIKGSYEIK